MNVWSGIWYGSEHIYGGGSNSKCSMLHDPSLVVLHNGMIDFGPNVGGPTICIKNTVLKQKPVVWERKLVDNVRISGLAAPIRGVNCGEVSNV